MTKAQLFSDELQHLSDVFKAFGHPARLAILQYLAEQKACITGDISEYIPLSRSTVNQHLTELKELGIIKGKIDGPRVNYCIDIAKLDSIKNNMADFILHLKTNTDTEC